MRKIIALIIIAVNIMSFKVYGISARSAVLIDLKSGRVLFEKNAYEKLPMASTTKIMTGLLACESNRLQEDVKVSPFASSTEGSSLWLKAGEKQPLLNLVYGLMLKSGNDAAVAIAEHLGGRVDAFSLLMNERARKIGANDTMFANPHGLDSENHYTTAYDLALITREAMKNNKFREIVSTKTYSIPMSGEKWGRALKNHNKLLWSYEGCNGVKTGFTKKSGRCLVSSAKKEDTALICVTLKAPDDWNDHRNLLDYGFSNYKSKNIIKKGTVATSVIYDEKYKRSVKLIYSEDFDVAVNQNDIITYVNKPQKIKYPANEKAFAGYTYIYCNGKEIGKIPMVTEKKISHISFSEWLKYIISKFRS